MKKIFNLNSLILFFSVMLLSSFLISCETDSTTRGSDNPNDLQPTLTISETQIYSRVGELRTLIVTALKADRTQDMYNIVSSDPDVVRLSVLPKETVSESEVELEFLAKGESVITVTAVDSGLTKECKVTALDFSFSQFSVNFPAVASYNQIKQQIQEQIEYLKGQIKELEKQTGNEEQIAALKEQIEYFESLSFDYILTNFLFEYIIPVYNKVDPYSGVVVQNVQDNPTTYLQVSKGYVEEFVVAGVDYFGESPDDLVLATNDQSIIAGMTQLKYSYGGVNYYTVMLQGVQEGDAEIQIFSPSLQISKTYAIKVVKVQPTIYTYTDSTFTQNYTEVNYVIGEEINPILPYAYGEIEKFYISPLLPTGLTFDSATGMISGTPEPTQEEIDAGIVGQPIQYHVTAMNSIATSTFSLTLAIGYVPATFSYTSPNVLNNSQEISPIEPDRITSDAQFSISPELPEGLVIDAATGIISGTPVADSPETTYTVTAANAFGQTTTTLVIEVVTPEVN